LGVLRVTNESGDPHSQCPRRMSVHPAFVEPLTELLAGIEALSDPEAVRRYRDQGREILDTPDIVRSLMHKAKVFTPQENIRREENDPTLPQRLLKIVERLGSVTVNYALYQMAEETGRVYTHTAIDDHLRQLARQGRLAVTTRPIQPGQPVKLLHYSLAGAGTASRLSNG